MKYIHYGIILLNRVQTQKHQGLLSKLFSVNSLDRELSQSNSGMSKGGYQGHPCYPIVHEIKEHYKQMNEDRDTYQPTELAKQQELHDQLIQDARDCLEEHPTGLIRSGTTKGPSLSILMEGYHWCECDHSNA